jgi:Periplasmic copper-binding protein (NosD)
LVSSGPNPGLSTKEDDMSSPISTSEPRRLAVGVVLAAVWVAGGASTITAQTPTEGATQAVKHVNCDGGQSLAHAVRHAKEGQTIRIRGTCHERVPITTPRLTLAGAGTAVIDGAGVELGPDPELDGLVVIDGVSGVTITGLTIQNASGNGVLAQRGAAFAVHEILVQDNAFTGIVVVDHSSAELTDSVTRRNRLGLDVVTSSSAVLKGTFSSNQNGNGVDVNGTSIVELRGARVELNENGGYGLVAASGSHVAIFGFQASRGSTLTANGNSFAGIILGSGILTAYVPAVISAANNAFGLFLNVDAKVVAPNGETTFRLDNNGVGMSVRGGSQLLIVGGLTVQGNGTGVLADAAGPLTLSSVPSNPSTITGNGTDMILLFGTRSTIDGVTIGTLVCDGTVLSRGTRTCP